MPPGPGTATHLPSDKFSPRLLHAEILPAKSVLLDEFLAPPELTDLCEYTLAHESDFQISEVLAPGETSAVDFDYRRSQVLMELGEFRRLIEGKLLSALPAILPRLNSPGFTRSRTEMQITASGVGQLGMNSEAELFKKIPNIDELGAFRGLTNDPQVAQGFADWAKGFDMEKILALGKQAGLPPPKP